MDNTPARRFRALVWLYLLCAMTLPGAVVSAQSGLDDGPSPLMSAQISAGGHLIIEHLTVQIEKAH